MTYDNDKAGTMSKSQTLAVAYGIIDDETVAKDYMPTMPTPSPSGGGHPPACALVGVKVEIRRLTPRECERLQGWPDDHTLVPYRGKPMSDGPRYKIIGNGWALPCVAWIARRIVANMTSEQPA